MNSDLRNIYKDVLKLKCDIKMRVENKYFLFCCSNFRIRNCICNEHIWIIDNKGNKL